MHCASPTGALQCAGIVPYGLLIWRRARSIGGRSGPCAGALVWQPRCHVAQTVLNIGRTGQQVPAKGAPDAPGNAAPPQQGCASKPWGADGRGAPARNGPGPEEQLAALREPSGRRRSKRRSAPPLADDRLTRRDRSTTQSRRRPMLSVATPASIRRWSVRTSPPSSPTTMVLITPRPGAA